MLHPRARAAATISFALAVDVVAGELPTPIHPVAGLGAIIGLLERRWRRRDVLGERVWGAFIVVAVVQIAALAGRLVQVRSRRAGLPGVAIGAFALKQAFSLRGLVAAGEDVRERLRADDIQGARDSAGALVSRDRAEIDQAAVVSATVESLAENLTDSVVAPLLYYALFDLPGAFAYRAINTTDAMIGYHGDYENVGKAGARADDAANLLPARLAGVVLCAVAATRGRGRASLTAMWRDRRLSESPNKMWTIAPMAAALEVRLEKPGHYATGEARRPLDADVIDEAISMVWVAGVAAALAAGALAAFMRRPEKAVVGTETGGARSNGRARGGDSRGSRRQRR
jgi:adenosylcobinamide-phosphate synthase